MAGYRSSSNKEEENVKIVKFAFMDDAALVHAIEDEMQGMGEGGVLP